MQRHKKFCLGSFLLVLTACGGGGGGSNSVVSNPVPVDGGETVLTGQFIDSAVSGIRYATETRSGITDSNGRFEYLAGETVSLYLGDLLLGDAPGAASINLFDLVDGVDPLVGNALTKTLHKLSENRVREQSRKRGPSFSTVINLATLLQTLDKDGNPDNGIEIPTDVAALFAADSVNFNQHWVDFPHEHGFRKGLAEAKSRALLDGERQVRKPWRVMAHVYASLGIDSKLHPSSVETLDIAYPGSPDITFKATFDDEGKLTRRERIGLPVGGEGYPGNIESYSYDGNGNLIHYENDYNYDGTSDIFIDYTYDADGNLTRKEVRGDSNPRLEITSYDAYGNETRFEQDNSVGYDYISNNIYDADGKLTRRDEDVNGDGVTDKSAVWTYTYTGTGYEVLAESDQSTSLSIYDADDNLLREENNNTDGFPVRVRMYTHDAQGNVIREDQDADGDGNIDSSNTIAYDAAGNVIRSEYDEDNNGVPDRIISYSYDASGNLTRYVDDGIAELQYSTAYEYDGEGNWVRSELDSDGDGVTNTIGLSTYDANGNPILRTEDYDLDGIPDSTSTWEYAADTDGWWERLQWPSPASASGSQPAEQ